MAAASHLARATRVRESRINRNPANMVRSWTLNRPKIGACDPNRPWRFVQRTQVLYAPGTGTAKTLATQQRTAKEQE